MTRTPAPLRLSLPDGSLHVDFVWRGDRYAHEFVLSDGSRVLSVEGNADQAWPPSPPLQQLSQELIGDSYAILGVGAAGQSHWSISVEVICDQGRHALKFDLACRSKTAPQWVGSTYRKSDQLRIGALGGSKISCHETGVVTVAPQERLCGGTAQWAYQVSAVTKNRP